MLTDDATMGTVAQPGLFTKKLEAALARWPGSRSALAKRVGVTRQSFQQYLSGSIPRADIAVKLAKELEVDPRWLLDEENESLEPVDEMPSLSDAPVNLFVAEGRARYIRAAALLKRAVDSARDQHGDRERGDLIDRSAMWVLFDHDPAKLPEQVKQVLDWVRRVDDRAYEVEKLRGFYREHDVTLNDAARAIGVDRSELSPESLLDRVRELQDQHPGYRAIVDYFCAQINDGFSDPKAKLDGFIEERAPFHLARLIDAPGVADYPHLEKLKADLRARGFLTKQGPMPFPEFQFYRMEPREVVDDQQDGEGEDLYPDEVLDDEQE